MTGAQALTMLMARMNRTNTTLRANALLEMIQYQKFQLEKSGILPDFLITRDATVSLSASNRQFTLPSDFLREGSFEDGPQQLEFLDKLGMPL